MDIPQLKTLLHVAELGSLSRAADRLGIAQPALSRQVRRLEHELGGPLFRRHGRGMVPTDMGRRVLAPVRDALAALSAVSAAARDARETLSGRVRFGMTPTVAEILTVPLARAIRAAHPALDLCFTVGFSGHLADWLKRDEIDCCVSYDTLATDAVRSHAVLDEMLLLVGSGARGFTMDRPVPFGTLTGEALVLPSSLHGLRRIVDTFAARAGVRLRPEMEVDALSALIEFVREGWGVTILPQAAIYPMILAGELSAAPLADPAPHRSVMLTFPVDRPVTPAVHAAGDIFVDLAVGLVRSGRWAGRLSGA